MGARTREDIELGGRGKEIAAFYLVFL